MSSFNAAPSVTHMALVSLLRAGRLTKIISTKVCTAAAASCRVELHGNTTLAKCPRWDREYHWDNRQRCQTKAKAHATGVVCDAPGCGRQLQDTIVNFGEYLHPPCCRSGEACRPAAVPWIQPSRDHLRCA